MQFLQRILRQASAVCIGLLLLWSFLTALAPSVFADGGAPNLAYVAGSQAGVSVIDIQQQKLTTNFTVPGNPRTLYLSLDGRFLYVTQPSLGQVTMLAAKTGEQICSVKVPGQPSLLVVDPYTLTLYAAGNDSPDIVEFDASNCAIKRTLTTSGPVQGLAAAVTSEGSQIWASNPNGIEVFDKSGSIAKFAIPGGPQYICIPPGTSAYITTQQGKVYAASIYTHKVSSELLTGGEFGPMDYDAYTQQVYVPDHKNRQIDVLTPISLSTQTLPHEPGRIIHTETAPQSVAITSDGQYGFIALAGGEVTMFDVTTRETITTFSVGGAPQFVITGLYPPVLGTTPQQTTLVGVVANVAGYALLGGVVIFLIFFLVRRSRTSTETREPQNDEAETSQSR